MMKRKLQEENLRMVGKKILQEVKQIRKVTNQPFFMTLKPIVVESFNCNCKPCSWFYWSSSIFFNPPLEHTTKTTFAKKTLGSKVSSCQLEIIKRELSESRSNFKFLFEFGCWRITLRITSGRRWDNCSCWLVSACIICRFRFYKFIQRTNIFNITW